MFKHSSEKRMQQFAEDFHEVGVLGMQKYFFWRNWFPLSSVLIMICEKWEMQLAKHRENQIAIIRNQSWMLQMFQTVIKINMKGRDKGSSSVKKEKE